MILSKKRITKVLIRLRGWAGWSAPVLCANPRKQVFSHCCPYYTLVFRYDLNGLVYKILVLKILNGFQAFVLSIFEWPLKTGFTVPKSHVLPQMCFFSHSVSTHTSLCSLFVQLSLIFHASVVVC